MARVTYDAIKKQIAKLEAQAKALEAAQSTKKAKAVNRVLAFMKKLGVELSDLTAVAATKRGRPAAATTRRAKGKVAGKGSRAAAAPKYRDPTTGVTWSGRGRTPVWLASYIAAGKSKEEFAIVNAPAAQA
jgi:DNA-binding protein H-NS